MNTVRGGGRNFRRNQTAEVQARLGLLPGILQAKQDRIAEERAEEMSRFQRKDTNRQFKLAKQQADFNKRRDNMALGIQGGMLGLNFATSDLGKKTLSSLNPWSKKKKPGTGGGLFSNMSVGSTVGGGLAGFGASRFAGKNKLKKAGLGLLAGGLMGGLTGGGEGKGFSFSNMFSGGASGLLGGLF